VGGVGVWWVEEIEIIDAGTGAREMEIGGMRGDDLGRYNRYGNSEEVGFLESTFGWVGLEDFESIELIK
jgi:hypothetical protein